jgi:hypothetical protein
MSMIRRAFLGLLFAAVLASCSSDAPPVPEADYPARLFGGYCLSLVSHRALPFATERTADEPPLPNLRHKRSVRVKCVTDRVRGTWAINGKVITLKVSDAEDVRLLSKTITSTIESFKPKEFVVKNERGDTSTFGRVLWFTKSNVAYLSLHKPIRRRREKVGRPVYYCLSRGPLCTRHSGK